MSTTTGKVKIEARVFRMGKKPKLVPSKLWLYMAHKRIPFTGRWENLGVIATRESGGVNVVHTSPSSARN